jgi:phytoene synthase
LLLVLCFSLEGAAWTTSTFRGQRTRLSSAVDNSGSGSSSDAAFAGGRLLEGGKVIDFSSLRASDHAERALRRARHREEKPATHGSAAAPAEGDHILGINQEVIQEVGHELGTYATEKEIQECAAYIRSKAPEGLFSETVERSNREYTVSEVAKYKALLAKAYEEAGEVTGAFAKTFYMGTMLLPARARQAIWAVYVWCRRTDEIVDAPRDSNDDMLADLSSWEMRLEELWGTGKVQDVFDLCLLDMRARYPTADIQPYLDMIRGMLMDVPGLGQDRYESFDELHLYCYRVAGTVGLMSLPIFGCSPRFTEDDAR